MKFVDCRSRNTAVRRCPGAFTFVRVDGGYMAFYCANALRTWRNQK